MNSYGDIVIFLGPPGSGKGSLSQLCVQKLGWIQLSTGNLCRKHIAENSAIGQKIDFAIKSGKLIDDELIARMVEEWLKVNLSKTSAVILDGFPRTVAQAQALQALLQRDFSTSKLYITKMSISDKSIIQRLANRSVCKNNECQAVYSTEQNSVLNPRDLTCCDKCSSPLVKRSDDNFESIQERLAIHYRHEQALVDFYNKHQLKIVEMAVERSLEEIFQDFTKLLGVSII